MKRNLGDKNIYGASFLLHENCYCVASKYAHPVRFSDIEVELMVI